MGNIIENSNVNIGGEGPNTKISYMYRDASNYKAGIEIVAEGKITPKEVQTLKDNLNDGEFFVPSMVGLPDLQERMSTPIGEDDHPYHEIDPERDIEYTREDPWPVDINIHDLVEKWKYCDWEKGGVEWSKEKLDYLSR